MTAVVGVQLPAFPFQSPTLSLSSALVLSPLPLANPDISSSPNPPPQLQVHHLPHHLYPVDPSPALILFEFGTAVYEDY